jgi:hypothetical protein
MTIRLTLLVLLTGLFAAAWSSDARDGAERRLVRIRQTAAAAIAQVEPAAPARPVAPVAPVAPVVIELPPPSDGPTDMPRALTTGPVLPTLPTFERYQRRGLAEVATRPVHWQAPRDQSVGHAVTEFDGVPLPGGIRPGTYRVVSNQGEVRSIELTADDLGGLPADGAQDLYIYRAGESRWYFVRLDDVPEAVLPPAVAEYPAERIAQREARRTLQRIGQRLQAAIAGADEMESQPLPVSHLATLRNWFSRLTPNRPAPLWAGRPAEIERR